jgi:hypothetical protein
MQLNELPRSVLVKLQQLTEQAEFLSQRADQLAVRLDYVRSYLSGRREDSRVDLKALQVEAAELEKDVPTICARAAAERSVLSRCKSWLDQLPSDTTLEVVQPEPAADDLDGLRQQIADLEQEIRTIKSAPVPSADVRRRVESRVAELANLPLRVDGVGSGQTLRIGWPGATAAHNAFPDEHSCNPLALFCRLFPDRMVNMAMLEINQLAREPMPVPERAGYIARCEREIDKLQRQEELLIEEAIENGAPVSRSPNATPQSVLGVQVRTTSAPSGVRKRVAA